MTAFDPATLSRLLRHVLIEEPQRLVAPPSWVGHIPFAFWIVGAHRPRILVELGTQTGNSYLAFVQAVKALGLSTECFAVDTWRGDPHSGQSDDQMLSELRDFHDPRYGSFSRLVQATFDEALGNFADGSVDLLHIDGYHTYEAVSHDFESWRPKLSERGVVLMHDINVREGDFGAWRLWEELAGRHPSFAFLHAHGLGVLAVGRRVAGDVRWLTSLERDAPQTVPALRDFFAHLGTGTLDRYERTRLAREAVHLQRQARTLEARVSDSTKEIARLQETVRRRDTKVARLQATLEQRESDHERLEARVRSAEGRGRDLEVRLAAVEEQTEKQRTGDEASAKALQRRLEQTEEALAAASTRVARLRDARTRLRTESEAVKSREAALATHARALEATLQETRASTSWRVTAPLRWVGGRVKPLWQRKGSLLARLRRSFSSARLALASPRRHRWVLEIRRWGYFDAEGYRRAADLGSPGLDPIEHFVCHGAGEGRSPHPLFDAAYYLDRYPRVAASGTNPLVYFLRRGAAEGHHPHPLFDTAYYLEQLTTRPGTDPLTHYLQEGAASGVDPHVLFSSSDYTRRNLEGAGATPNPLSHYVQHGAALGRRPHPLFDPDLYLQRHPQARDEGALLHFLRSRGEDRFEWNTLQWPSEDEDLLPALRRKEGREQTRPEDRAEGRPLALLLSGETRPGLVRLWDEVAAGLGRRLILVQPGMPPSAPAFEVAGRLADGATWIGLAAGLSPLLAAALLESELTREAVGTLVVLPPLRRCLPLAQWLVRRNPDLQVVGELPDPDVAASLVPDTSFMIFGELIARTTGVAEGAVKAGLARDRVHMVPPAVSSERFDSSTTDVEGVRRRLGLAPGQRLVLFLGSLEHSTRPLDFVGLASLFRPEEALFVLAGDGPLSDAIDREIKRTALPHVRRVPFEPEPASLLAAAEVVVQTAESGLWSRVLLEAQAVGRPVVTTARGEAREVLEHTGGGCVVAGRADVNGLARAVRTLLDSPPDPAAIRSRLLALRDLGATLPLYEAVLRQ